MERLRENAKKQELAQQKVRENRDEKAAAARLREKKADLLKQQHLQHTSCKATSELTKVTHSIESSGEFKSPIQNCCHQFIFTAMVLITLEKIIL